MNRSVMYEIRVENHLPDHWSDWFEGLVIHNEPDDGASLTGPLPDQSALMNILTRLTTLNITLVSVIKVPKDKGDAIIQGDSSPCC
jgi:hypothetical protein